jgi:hypothetical protein
MPENLIPQSGLHPSNTIRHILQKRQRARKIEHQAFEYNGGGFHKTRITQSMRFKVLIKLKTTLKSKEDWYKKICAGLFNNK